MDDENPPISQLRPTRISLIVTGGTGVDFDDVVELILVGKTIARRLPGMPPFAGFGIVENNVDASPKATPGYFRRNVCGVDVGHGAGCLKVSGSDPSGFVPKAKRVNTFLRHPQAFNPAVTFVGVETGLAVDFDY